MLREIIKQWEAKQEWYTKSERNRGKEPRRILTEMTIDTKKEGFALQ